MRDLIESVRQRCKVYGNSEAANWFCRHMTQAERNAFDAWLVEIGHPLAYQPGTQESRFVSIVTKPEVCQGCGECLSAEDVARYRITYRDRQLSSANYCDICAQIVNSGQAEHVAAAIREGGHHA